jgi:hypothetical protein
MASHNMDDNHILQDIKNGRVFAYTLFVLGKFRGCAECLYFSFKSVVQITANKDATGGV